MTEQQQELFKTPPGDGDCWDDEEDFVGQLWADPPSVKLQVYYKGYFYIYTLSSRERAELEEAPDATRPA